MNRLLQADWDFLAIRLLQSENLDAPPLSLQELDQRTREHDDWMDVLNFWTELLLPPWSSELLPDDDDVPMITVICSPRWPEPVGVSTRQERASPGSSRIPLPASPGAGNVEGATRESAIHRPTFSPAHSGRPLGPSPLLNPNPSSAFPRTSKVPPSPGRERLAHGYVRFLTEEPEVVNEPALRAIVLPNASLSDLEIPRISKRRRCDDDTILRPRPTKRTRS